MTNACQRVLMQLYLKHECAPSGSPLALPSVPSSVISGQIIVWQETEQAVIKELKLDHN